MIGPAAAGKGSGYSSSKPWRPTGPCLAQVRKLARCCSNLPASSDMWRMCSNGGKGSSLQPVCCGGRPSATQACRHVVHSALRRVQWMLLIFVSGPPNYQPALRAVCGCGIFRYQLCAGKQVRTGHPPAASATALRPCETRQSHRLQPRAYQVHPCMLPPACHLDAPLARQPPSLPAAHPAPHAAANAASAAAACASSMNRSATCMSSGVVTLMLVYDPGVICTGSPRASMMETSSVTSSPSRFTSSNPVRSSAGRMTCGAACMAARRGAGRAAP